MTITHDAYDLTIQAPGYPQPQAPRHGDPTMAPVLLDLGILFECFLVSGYVHPARGTLTSDWSVNSLKWLLMRIFFVSVVFRQKNLTELLKKLS